MWLLVNGPTVYVGIHVMAVCACAFLRVNMCGCVRSHNDLGGGGGGGGEGEWPAAVVRHEVNNWCWIIQHYP